MPTVLVKKLVQLVLISDLSSIKFKTKTIMVQPKRFFQTIHSDFLVVDFAQLVNFVLPLVTLIGLKEVPFKSGNYNNSLVKFSER